ncbi:MAG: hypothetical protein D6682_08190 [Zetaproteobacteria bacterium]|nr:MAG: hypothetical protein D6682_08190 [Zetaproteobacteria bacterium]
MNDARKAREIREYFDRNGRVHLVLDATRDDVVVPPHLKEDPALCLLISVRMPQRIEISKDGLKSVFSFSGRPFACHVPMAAIWAAYRPGTAPEDGLIWIEDIPPSVRRAMASVLEEAAEAPRRAAVARRPEEGTGRSSDGGGTEGAPESSAPESKQEGRKPRRGHLRIV